MRLKWPIPFIRSIPLMVTINVCSHRFAHGESSSRKEEHHTDPSEMSKIGNDQEQMKKKYSYIIVGSGTAGVTTAYFLSKCNPNLTQVHPNLTQLNPKF